jgi:two-component system phosphate regulon response regulator PhoB
MPKEKILVIDDEEDIRELVKYNLAGEGYKIFCASSGEKALKKNKDKLLDLIVLGLMLPGIDGLEVTKILKNDPKTEHIPIIMLTAKEQEADIVTGLELGADDYITKSFSPKVLVARIRAAIHRKKNEYDEGESEIEIHGLAIHPGMNEVLINGRPWELTFTEFQVLYSLAKRPGWVFTRSHNIDSIRGGDYPVTDRSVDVQIVGLSKKLGSYNKYIETVRGIGYRLKEK